MGNVSFDLLSFMLRRDLFNNFRYNETLTKNQDLDFFFRFFISRPNLKIAHVNEIFYTVRSHKDSMTSDTSRNVSELISSCKVYLMILNHFSNNKHKKGIIIHKYYCLETLMVLLKNAYYVFVIKRLLLFNHLNILEKLYLICCVLSQILVNRGCESTYSKYYK